MRFIYANYVSEAQVNHINLYRLNFYLVIITLECVLNESRKIKRPILMNLHKFVTCIKMSLYGVQK